MLIISGAVIIKSQKKICIHDVLLGKFTIQCLNKATFGNGHRTLSLKGKMSCIEEQVFAGCCTSKQINSSYSKYLNKLIEHDQSHYSTDPGLSGDRGQRHGDILNNVMSVCCFVTHLVYSMRCFQKNCWGLRFHAAVNLGIRCVLPDCYLSEEPIHRPNYTIMHCVVYLNFQINIELIYLGCFVLINNFRNKKCYHHIQHSQTFKSVLRLFMLLL